MTILAVGAHPDDIELGCGGTLASLTRLHERVVMLVMTEGQRGPGGDRDRRVERLVAVRREEQERAAELLGAEVIWGGLMDCEVIVNHDTIDRVTEVIDDVDPRVIVTHWGQDSHQDHRAVSSIVTAAARRHPNVLYFGGPTSLGFVPSIYVDVTGSVDAKISAIALHKSQAQSALMPDAEGVRALARAVGIAARVPYAEGFVPLRLAFAAEYLLGVRAAEPDPTSR